MNLSQNLPVAKKQLDDSLSSQNKNNSKTTLKTSIFKRNYTKNTKLSYSQDDSIKIQSTMKVKETTDSDNNNDYILKLIKTNCPNLINHRTSTKIEGANKTNLKSLTLKKQKRDDVQAFFNRNFYSCEIPVPKKIIENQKLLDYFMKDKENKEKYKQLLKINRNKIIYDNKMKSSRNINFNSSKILNNIIENKNVKSKNNIKKSLMLNDFRMYDKIHRIVRFWGKFINYACPIFQVEKFKLNGLKYRNKSDIMNEKKEENNKNNIENNYKKLPNLYTNSSKIFRKSEILYNNHSNKFNRKSLSCSNIYS